jgi:hypothetical protein
LATCQGNTAGLGPVANFSRTRDALGGGTAVADAVHYSLRITDSHTGKTIVSIGNLTGTSVTLSAAHALTPGVGYMWTVTAVSTNGLASSKSTPAAFSIDALPAPTPISPSGPTPTLKPTFTWVPVTDAGHYDLEVISSAGHVIVQVTNIKGASYTLQGSLKKARAIHGKSPRSAPMAKAGRGARRSRSRRLDLGEVHQRSRMIVLACVCAKLAGARQPIFGMPPAP